MENDGERLSTARSVPSIYGYSLFGGVMAFGEEFFEVGPQVGDVFFGDVGLHLDDDFFSGVGLLLGHVYDVNSYTVTSAFFNWLMGVLGF